MLRPLEIFCGIAVWAHAPLAQTAGELPHFDAATLKPVAFSGPVFRREDMPATMRNPGRVRFTKMGLDGLIRWAYQLEWYQLSAPGWVSSVNYDFEAVFPAGTPDSQVRLMGQALLAERLRLRAHRETKEMPIYAVSVANGGLKMRRVPDQSEGESGGLSHRQAGSTKLDWEKGKASLNGVLRTIPELVTGLNLDGCSSVGVVLDIRNMRPVLDYTGLPGLYEVNLQYEIDPELRCADRATKIKALERQVGLKVEAKKAAVEVLVVDSVERAPVPD